MMNQDERQLLLERLIEALHQRMVMVELVNRLPGQPKRWVAKDVSAIPAITARIRDYQRPVKGPWLYWWTWWQPVRSVEDMERVADTFCDVVLAVEGET